MNDWRKIEDLVLYTGKGITPKYVDDSSIIVLNQKCIRNHKIDYSFARFTNDTVNISTKKFIKRGDILINSTGRGTAGRCAFVEELTTEKSVIVDSHILVLRLKNYYEAQCLSYILYSFEELIKSFIDGSTGQGELDKIRVLNLLIPLSDNPETQKKIAKVLSDLDKKIELNTKINSELESMAKLLYDYWFVQFDFPNKEGKPYKSAGGKMVFNEVLKREIPLGWEVKELHEIANITMGQSPAGSSYNDEAKGMIFFQGSTDFGWRFPKIRQYTTEPKRLAKKGDILLSVRAPVGTLNVADVKCCVGRGLAALNSKDNFTSYLYYVMEYFKQIFDNRNNTGTTFGSITKDDLFSLKLVYPTQKQLQDYDKVVENFNETILNNHKQNQQLTELRDFLLPMLMNGQVVVK